MCAGRLKLGREGGYGVAILPALRDRAIITPRGGYGMTGRKGFLFVPAAILAASPLLGLGTASARSLEIRTLSDVLPILPEQTDSILVAQGPYQLPEDPHRLDDPDALSDADVFRALVTWSINLNDPGYLEPLAHRDLRMAIVATRHRATSHTPEEPDFIEIVVLADRRGFDLFGSAEGCATYPHGHLLIEGFDVRVVDDDDFPLLFVQPAPQLIVLANDQDLLRETLEGLRDARDHKRSVVESSRLWDFVDIHAPVWGIRQFREDADAELSTKLTGGPKAVGISMEFVGRDDVWAKITYELERSQVLTTTGLGEFLGFSTLGLSTSEASELRPGIVQFVLKKDDRGESMEMTSVPLFPPFRGGRFLALEAIFRF